MLFQKNGKSVMFSLKDMTEEELLELTDLIKKNGGTIVDHCIFIFTNPDMYTGEKSAFDKKYIYECVRLEKIINLNAYMIEGKPSRSCLTTLLLTGGERCNCPSFADSNFCDARSFIKENEKVTLETEKNNYAKRDCANGNQSEILSTEEVNDTPFSDRIYYPDDTQSQQFINQEENIEKGSNEKRSPNIKKSKVISDSETECDEVTKTQNKTDSETHSEEKFSPLIDSEFGSDSDSPKISKKKLKRTSTKKNISKLSDAIYYPDDTQSQQFINRDENIEKGSNEKRSPNMKKSRVISDSETECDEVTETQNNTDSETHSEEKFSPLINSEFGSDSDSPKISKKKLKTITSTEKNISKLSIKEKTTKFTSTKSDQLRDRKSSSDEDSSPEKLERIALPSCSKESTSKPRIRKIQRCATRNFMPWEQKEMVGYLIKNNYICKARGNTVWKRLISDGFLKHRTYQSLQNHFRRFILPNIHKYSMDAEHQAKFKKLQSG